MMRNLLAAAAVVSFTSAILALIVYASDTRGKAAAECQAQGGVPVIDTRGYFTCIAAPLIHIRP